MKDITEKAQEALSLRLKTSVDTEERALLLKALSRISEGSFGTCERCQKAIGRHRLSAEPEATLCLHCS